MIDIPYSVQMRLLIDLDNETLEKIEKLSVQEDRSRKKVIERIIKESVK